MQILESVVNDRKPKMLAGFSCSGYRGSPLFRHGRTTLPAYREHLLYRVTSTEQGKPVAPPARGSEVARPIDGEAGMRSGRKRKLFRNGADSSRTGLSLGLHRVHYVVFAILHALDNPLRTVAARMSPHVADCRLSPLASASEGD